MIPASTYKKPHKIGRIKTEELNGNLQHLPGPGEITRENLSHSGAQTENHGARAERESLAMAAEADRR
jgi:hypothetical protein